MKVFQKKANIIFSTVIGFSVLFLALLARPMKNDNEFDNEFDSQKWLAAINEIEIPTTRQRMIDDIRKNVLTLDITAEEIEAIFGKSDTDSKYQSYDFVYYLGPERDSYIAIDSDWLCIMLDEHGHFAQADIRTD